MTLTVRDALDDDVELLWEMLTHAATMPAAGAAAAVEEARGDPYLRTYVEGWGRAGDLGVIAERDGQPVGAAWVRIGAGSSAPPDTGIPELATATVPADRGGGAGSAMLARLIARARGAYPAIVLSVRDGNPAVRLYARAGFRTEHEVVNRVGGRSLVMRLDL